MSICSQTQGNSSKLLAMVALAAMVPAALPETARAHFLGDSGYVGADSQQITVNVGQSLIVPLSDKVRRVAVANQNVADYRQTGPSQLYLIGRQVGNTDITVWYASGYVQTFKVATTLDPAPLRHLVDAVTNGAAQIDILVSGSSFVLQGMVADVPTVDAVLRVAEAYASSLSRSLDKLESGGGEQKSGSDGAGSSGGTQPGSPAPLLALVNQTAAPGSDRAGSRTGHVRIINALSVGDSQQVLLQVRILEMTHSLARRLGVSMGASQASGSWNWRVGSAFLGDGAGTAKLSYNGKGPNFAIDLDAESKDGDVRILAEPTIAAMSGTEGNFLVGGSVFIPTPTSSYNEGSSQSISLQERDFGVSLKFKPVVLTDRMINLELTSEVSELSREGVAFQTGTSSTILPTLTKSKFGTTVQLREGQSLIIGGLLKNNITQTKGFIPILGELPILGVLFRSKAYASDRTELVVVVRPVFAQATDTPPHLSPDPPESASPLSEEVAPPAAEPVVVPAETATDTP